MVNQQGLGHWTGNMIATGNVAGLPAPPTLRTCLCACTLIFGAIALGGMSPASALSEFKPAEAPDPAQAPDPDVPPDATGAAGDDELSPAETPPLEGPLTGADGGLPSPGPVIRQRLDPDPAAEQQDETPAIGDTGVSVDVITDLAALPEPVQRMRELMIAAAATGDPEQLRPLLGIGAQATQLALSSIDSDPVDYIRSTSGDGQGLEILAILIDLLNTGAVRIAAGEPDEIYIWPYFAALPLEGLTPAQQVDLLRIVTAGDVEDMRAYGGYNFYRVGITPEGEWRFFMAGD